jgi:hypothetical protein
MEVCFTPEVEAKLNELGTRAGKDAEYIVQEIVRRLIYHDSAIVAILKSEQS